MDRHSLITESEIIELYPDLVPTRDSLPPMCSLAQAAQILDVQIRTVRGYVNQGLLSAARSGTGSRVRIPRPAVLRLLASRLGHPAL